MYSIWNVCRAYIVMLFVSRVCGTPSVGRAAGRNFVFLGESCEHESGIMTLVLVSLGMFYEHGRPDRDTYIQVHMDNVVQGNISLSSKMPF